MVVSSFRLNNMALSTGASCHVKLLLNRFRKASRSFDCRGQHNQGTMRYTHEVTVVGEQQGPTASFSEPGAWHAINQHAATTHLFPLTSIVVAVTSSERQEKIRHAPLASHSHDVAQARSMPLRAAHHRARHFVLGDMPDDLSIRGIGMLATVVMDGFLQHLLTRLHTQGHHMSSTRHQHASTPTKQHLPSSQ